MLSGLLDEFDPRHLKRIQREIEEKSGSSAVIQVPTVPLTKILGDLHLNEVHYLSVDTEGNEADVLASVDFDSVRFTSLLLKQTTTKHGTCSTPRFGVIFTWPANMCTTCFSSIAAVHSLHEWPP